MEIFLANFLETKRLSLMNSGDLLNMCHCKDYLSVTKNFAFMLNIATLTNCRHQTTVNKQTNKQVKSVSARHRITKY